MRRTAMMSVLTLGLALAPATLAAQQPGPARHAHGGPRFGANPAARVLALPTVLELNASQLSRLEQIRDRAEAENQPLLAQLQGARTERPARQPGAQGVQPEQRRAQMQQRREQLQAQRERLQPVLTKLRENAEKTRREVESVLTSSQLAKLRELETVLHPGGERGPRAGGGRGLRPAR